MLPRMLAAIPLLAAGAAFAQTDTINVGGVNWKPVDQAHADRGPLSFSLRDTRVDLRLPTNFDRVYEIDGKPRFFGGPPTSDYYMRMSGGLTAVFPRSSYTNVGPGVERANIPAGTTFSIGGPVSKLVSAQPDKSNGPKKAPSARVDQSAPKINPASASQPAAQPAPDKARLDKPVNAATPPPPAKEPEKAPAPRVVPPPASLSGTIWNNEQLRKQRVAALLDEAAKSKK